MCCPPLCSYLGNLSFPIFIVHGALGQLFYKKVIASKVCGGARVSPACSPPARDGLPSCASFCWHVRPAALLRAGACPSPPLLLTPCCSLLCLVVKVWGKVMGLDFFPIYCAIVVAFAAACQHLFLVRAGEGVSAVDRRGSAGSQCIVSLFRDGTAGWAPANAPALPLSAAAPTVATAPWPPLPTGEQEGAGDQQEHHCQDDHPAVLSVWGASAPLLLASQPQAPPCQAMMSRGGGWPRKGLPPYAATARRTLPPLPPFSTRGARVGDRNRQARPAGRCADSPAPPRSGRAACIVDALLD